METTRSLQKLAGWGGRVFFGNRDVSERVDGMVPYFFPFKAMQEYAASEGTTLIGLTVNKYVETEFLSAAHTTTLCGLHSDVFGFLAANLMIVSLGTTFSLFSITRDMRKTEIDRLLDQERKKERLRKLPERILRGIIGLPGLACRQLWKPICAVGSMIGKVLDTISENRSRGEGWLPPYRSPAELNAQISHDRQQRFFLQENIRQVQAQTQVRMANDRMQWQMQQYRR